ncbi:MAG: hypothetical protein HYY61_02890 [Deltaproteobacteria bacterium]|nr:hypothetical protein [Deltaproteobacteria bacterium]
MEKKLLEKFIHLLANKVDGKWIIIGGSVLPLLEASFRHTQDIDIVGPSSSTQKDTLTLMEIAQSLGLPIEAINQAASFFLYKIPNWEKELVLIHKSPKASIFRPSATLYILLKLKRLSETDFEDCMKMIEYAKIHKESIDKKRIQKIIHTLLKKETSEPKIKRLKNLILST